MNDNRMKRWMDAIDDDLLEEAQRPLPRGGAARRWGALAACFCAAALALALWQPWSAGIGDNTAGADADFGGMDKSFSVAMPPVSDAELLSASLALPEGASLTSGYQWRQDGEGAVTFSGVAPDAQVIPMKVFDDSGTGAATTTILAALEDAYRLGVDAVNLSLGSYGGFTVDEDALINDVYNKLDDAGIMVITAVGNETSSSYMNSYGTDAPLTGDPDNSVVAAPYDYKDGKCTVCGAADPDYRPEQPENPGQPEKPEQPANPGVKTGDSGVLLYIGLMLLALTGSAWVLRKKRAR